MTIGADDRRIALPRLRAGRGDTRAVPVICVERRSRDRLRLWRRNALAGHVSDDCRATLPRRSQRRHASRRSAPAWAYSSRLGATSSSMVWEHALPKPWPYIFASALADSRMGAPTRRRSHSLHCNGRECLEHPPRIGALPPLAACPLYPRKRTKSRHLGMSALCQILTSR